MNYVVIAPHADDEIIGCFHFLNTNLVRTVLFSSSKACAEAIASSKFFGFTIDHLRNLLNHQTKILLFPDPIYELHPEHRRIGMLGEELLRKGVEVIFYSTNMNAPYIHEVKTPLVKRARLDDLYSAKKDLWQFEHKYFLFEGYTQWIIPKKAWQD